MTVSPTLLLVFYCAAIAAFSMLGGQLPNWVRMTHTRTQVAMSLVSGLMLGVAFYHLLPHSVTMQAGPGAADTSVRWLMFGLITMLLLLRLFHFHQHDFSHEEEDHHDHHHDHAHVYSHPAPASSTITSVANEKALSTYYPSAATKFDHPDASNRTIRQTQGRENA